MCMQEMQQQQGSKDARSADDLGQPQIQEATNMTATELRALIETLPWYQQAEVQMIIDQWVAAKSLDRYVQYQGTDKITAAIEGFKYKDWRMHGGPGPEEREVPTE
jgi:hypothetical protein